MSDDRDTSTRRGPQRLLHFPRLPGRRNGGAHTRVKKLRLLLILVPLGVLALISTFFGMMMAVASDLPKLENRQEFKRARNSVLLDDQGRQLGILTGAKNAILASDTDISPAIKHAIIAVEDERFYENSGVDLRGMARALYSDVIAQRVVSGASTISQQFVKQAMAAQGNRTVLEKLREAALAYHLNRKWTKDKILTEYLNSIYFGNGAYGVEQAARVYFGKAHPDCGAARPVRFCASELTTAEGALLAGLVQSPSAYDPIAHPEAARARRNVVLSKMRSQGYISTAEYRRDLRTPLPTQAQITPPLEHSQAPYFTTWVRQLVVDRFGATRAFTGGLKIKTSLDLDLQRAAEQAIADHLPAGEGLPSAALVAIDNKTGEVRAMVGGNDYTARPFNLATQGQRQPGSSFKPFVLAAALEKGYSINSTWASKRKIFTVPNTNGKEHFIVNNFANSYSGSNTLGGAMTVSDNSIYAEVGIDTGTKRIAKLARRMGIRTPVSHNYAMTLGGLKKGVTPLDMAHAYETFATGGKRVTSANGLGSSHGGPVGIEEVRGPGGDVIVRNEPRYRQILPAPIASTVRTTLQTVVQSGTGRAANIGGFAAGKTGTTENYGDAWFVGWSKDLTVAIWVGYPDRLVPMEHQYNGGPVEGGTFPAEIWGGFVSAAENILATRAAQRGDKDGGDSGPTDTYGGDGGSGTYTSPAAGSTGSPGYGGAPATGTDGESGGYSGPATGTDGQSGGYSGPATGGDTGGGDTGSGTVGGGGGTTGGGGDTGVGGGGTTGGGGDTGSGTVGGGGTTGGGGDTGAGGGGDTGAGGGGTTGGGGDTGAGGGGDTGAGGGAAPSG